MNRRLHACVVAFAVVYGVSAWTAWPGLSALDGGDFITAGSVLGVPHATGFPIHVQATGVGSLLPWGNLAWRCALVSAFFSGVAAALFTWWGAAVARLDRGAWPVAAAVCVGFLSVDTLVLHARVTEVYALNLALIGAALVALERLEQTEDLRWRTVLALVCGLGLANHALFRLWLIPLVAASVWLTPARDRLRGMTGALLIGTAALLAYGYLAASALAEPPHNWGDPSTLDRWWAHVTARDIRSAFADQMMPGGFQLKVYAAQLASQMLSGLGLLAVLGLFAAWAKARPKVALVLGALVAIEVVYSVAINPMGLRDFQNGQLLAVALAMSAGASVAWLSRRLGQERSALVVGGSIGLVALGFAAEGHRFAGSGGDWTLEDVVVVELGVAEPDALIAPVSDSLTAGFLYASAGLGARPDAFCLGRYLLSDDAAAARAVESAPFEVVPENVRAEWLDGGFGQTTLRSTQVLQHNVGTRPIHWEVTGRSSELPQGLALEHRWPLGTVVLEGEQADRCFPPERGWCGDGDVGFGASARETGYFYGRWAARQWGFIGAEHFRAGEYELSGEAFEIAARLNPEAGPWLTGIALSLANTGRLEEAMAIQEAALLLSPLSVQAHRNAALFADALGDRDRAAEAQLAVDALEGD